MQIRTKRWILNHPIMQICQEIHILINIITRTFSQQIRKKQDIFLYNFSFWKPRDYMSNIHTQQLGDDLCCCNAANVFHCEPPETPCFSIPLICLVFASPFTNTNACEYNFIKVILGWNNGPFLRNDYENGKVDRQEMMKKIWKSLLYMNRFLADLGGCLKQEWI